MSATAKLSGWLLSLFLVACLVSAAVAANEFGRTPEPKSELRHGPILPPTSAISLEADVFRTRWDMLVIPPGSPRSRPAIPRSEHKYRVLRAYPGAPPSIPHGFTGDEYRAGTCNTCHERGGYSPRFNAYVPVTPHPEMVACLQCHVGNDDVTGVALPDTDPNTVCRQCHPRSGARAIRSTLDWQPMEWPELGPKSIDGPPPDIPHDQPLRGNCVACHVGPAALDRIRIDHPERASCRQCHVASDSTLPLYRRPAQAEAEDRS